MRNFDISTPGGKKLEVAIQRLSIKVVNSLYIFNIISMHSAVAHTVCICLPAWLFVFFFLRSRGLEIRYIYDIYLLTTKPTAIVADFQRNLSPVRNPTDEKSNMKSTSTVLLFLHFAPDLRVEESAGFQPNVHKPSRLFKKVRLG